MSERDVFPIRRPLLLSFVRSPSTSNIEIGLKREHDAPLEAGLRADTHIHTNRQKTGTPYAAVRGRFQHPSSLVFSHPPCPDAAEQTDFSSNTTTQQIHPTFVNCPNCHRAKTHVNAIHILKQEEPASTCKHANARHTRPAASLDDGHPQSNNAPSDPITYAPQRSHSRLRDGRAGAAVLRAGAGLAVALVWVCRCVTRCVV